MSSLDRQKAAAGTANPEDLRSAMRSYVTGVTVVTTRTDAGSIAGMTASSFTSVSLDPPLVLVCLSSRSRSYRTMLQSRQVAIHILADDQSDLARAFASQGGDRSTICNWSISSRGNAILEACLIVLECSVHDVQEAGDHAIVIARVEAIETRNKGSGPLVYHEGRMSALEARSN